MESSPYILCNKRVYAEQRALRSMEYPYIHCLMRDTDLAKVKAQGAQTVCE